ncbi:ABC-2 type transport system ATP-binding protein [Geodermatophilus saharensis]|uniref:ABC-2 type transport system ATP-binding protein n=1 Tax=Geodermatophilus saharensis TaxID=1137994 RepID=A0A239II61_9ACTN|nr:ABC transporter ATP-binding protein [Geodermatophilus saharensis]SNS93307.1 ABC-2 type transport system ATP-binding protein [Geodermatophilus saharensis]
MPRPAPPSDDRVIEVRGLRMSYGSTEVLTGVDLTVSAGEVVCLLGPNGAGKTTTIEVLEGFRLPSAGHVRVLGADPARADDAWRARVGVVLQSWRDHARWTPRRLLEQLGGYYAPYATAERPRPYDVDWLLDVVGMTEFADRRIGTLSGGQRRRLDVAVGIIGRPELLFLDEPTAGFDPQARRDFHDLVHRLSDLEGTSILLTTHDLAEAERLADRILVLADGRIVADGSPDALTRQVAGTSEVRWACGRERFVHGTDDVVAFVRGLFEQHGDALTDLEVRHASLEDTYLAMVQRFEAGARSAPALEVTR